jgi:Ca2+-binding EF-hand superfamily protein
MTTNLRLSLAALVAGAALAGAANAQGRIEALDTNHDGLLSRAEAQAHPHLGQNFDAIDANHDGQLSRDELMAWHQQHRKGGEGRHGGGLQRLDTNHDGQLERSEVADNPRLQARFDAADTNHDGVLSRDELRAARAAHRRASMPMEPSPQQ